MPRERDVPDEGGARPLETYSETAGGIPDDAVGPEQRTIPEQLELTEETNAEAMAAKLQAEADAHEQTGRLPPQTPPQTPPARPSKPKRRPPQRS